MLLATLVPLLPRLLERFFRPAAAGAAGAAAAAARGGPAAGKEGIFGTKVTGAKLGLGLSSLRSRVEESWVYGPRGFLSHTAIQ